MSKYHNIQKITFEKNDILICINGNIMRFPLEKISKKLIKASSRERNALEISPSGYGIHWPLLDEDLSIDGLLGITHHRKEKSRAA